MTTRPENQRLSEIAVKAAFLTVDGLSIRFAESDRRGADALLLSPWPESVFAYEPMWAQLAETGPPGRDRSSWVWPLRAERRVDVAARDGRLRNRNA